MKKCPNCGKENNVTASFCKICGHSLLNETEQPQPQKYEKRYSFFVEPSETMVAELGHNYVQNYISTGTISNGFAVVTQKRVYFKGKCYSNINGKWKKSPRNGR